MAESDDMHTVEILLQPREEGGEGYTEEELVQAIIENQDEFHPLFERIIDNGDSRLEIVDDSMVFGEMKFNDNVYTAYFMFGTSHYMGCKDMMGDDDYEVKLEFTIDDNSMYFNMQLPHAWLPM